MKKNMLIQVGTRTEQRTRIIPATYDEEGNIIADEYTEEYTVAVPVIEARNVDMTPEEIAEFERQQAELPPPEPTPEERLDALETTTDDMILLMADLIGGV